MDSQQFKVLGIVALVLCVVCIFIAIERYHNNAEKVEAINQMRQSSPFGGVMPGMPGMQGEMKAAIPAATKYAGFFAILFGVGGIVLLVMAGNAANKPAGDKSADT